MSADALKYPGQMSRVGLEQSDATGNDILNCPCCYRATADRHPPYAAKIRPSL